MEVLTDLPPAFLHGGDKDKNKVKKLAMVSARNGFRFTAEGESSDSSSIGAESSPSSSSSSSDDDEAQSDLKPCGPLGSMDSLEESLPMKRGLSNFFTGKSKSFASLSEVGGIGGADVLAKPENPFNKRRRILTSWARRASYSSIMTALTVTEEGEAAEDDHHHGAAPDEMGSSLLPPLLPRGDYHPESGKVGKMRMSIKSLRSPRSFSLSDLQHV